MQLAIGRLTMMLDQWGYVASSKLGPLPRPLLEYSAKLREAERRQKTPPAHNIDINTFTTLAGARSLPLLNLAATGTNGPDFLVIRASIHTAGIPSPNRRHNGRHRRTASSSAQLHPARQSATHPSQPDVSSLA